MLLFKKKQENSTGEFLDAADADVCCIQNIYIKLCHSFLLSLSSVFQTKVFRSSLWLTILLVYSAQRTLWRVRFRVWVKGRVRVWYTAHLLRVCCDLTKGAGPKPQERICRKPEFFQFRLFF